MWSCRVGTLIEKGECGIDKTERVLLLMQLRIFIYVLSIKEKVLGVGGHFYLDIGTWGISVPSGAKM